MHVNQIIRLKPSVTVHPQGWNENTDLEIIKILEENFYKVQLRGTDISCGLPSYAIRNVV
jgi:hypothetical protein